MFQLLLNMTFSASWCMTAGVITKVAQVNICILQISNLVKDYLPFDLTSVTYVYFHPDSNNINSIQFF